MNFKTGYESIFAYLESFVRKLLVSESTCSPLPESTIDWKEFAIFVSLLDVVFTELISVSRRFTLSISTMDVVCTGNADNKGQVHESDRINSDREMLTAVAQMIWRKSIRPVWLPFCYIRNHVMTGPLGNSKFCFSRISMFHCFVSLESQCFVKIRGKQNSMSTSGPVIKR